jgi:hypothetical protein
MPAFLDDRPFASAATTLDGLLDAARQDAEAQGRMIVEVAIGGQSLLGDALDAQRGQALPDADVRLYSADAAQIAVEALHELRGSMDRIDQLHDTAAEQLQRGEQAQGLQTVGQVIELWLGVQQGVGQVAGLAEIDLDRLPVGDTTAKDLFALLLARLHELKALIEANDTVALADALAYEWSEITAPWADLIDALIARLDPPHA